MLKGLILAAVIAAGAAPAYAQSDGVQWLDSFKDVRVGRVDGVIWAYWFGYSGDRVLVRKRVIMADGVTVQDEGRAKQWAAGNDTALPRQDASEAIWNDPRTAAARAALEAAYEAERKAGTIPKPRLWRVAPNPVSTTSPPSRPMFDPTGAKLIADRSIVGDRCDCARAQVIKGTQTLCPLHASVAGVSTSGNVTACVRDDPPK